MYSKRKQILDWLEAGLLAPSALDLALQSAEAIPSKKSWLLFFEKSLLGLGALALSSGVIFFFAYNWNEMGRFLKFALANISILILLASYYIVKSSPLINAILLFLLSISVGVLLALLGQTYQTGADPWQLFAIWCCLITPFAIISRSSSVWLLWGGLINLSLFLYWDSVHSLFGLFFSTDAFVWPLAILNSLLLIIYEALSAAKHVNKAFVQAIAIPNRYAAQICALVAGTYITCLGLISIFDSHPPIQGGLIIYLLWITAAFFTYRYKFTDLLLLSALSLSGIIIVTSVVIEVIDFDLDNGGFLFIAFLIILQSSIAGILLKKFAAIIKDEATENKGSNNEELNHAD